jgi:uncharacterized DUF497 family protein
MFFEWDSRKAAANLKKHSVSFEEAMTVFLDDHALTGADPDHSVGESRWLIIGRSTRGRMLVVAHADDGGIIRLINARAATRREKHLYEEG